MTEGTNAFRVDLRGLVDLLARHVYSSPRVYLRELLQNGVDAVTARRLLDPAAPAGPVRVVPADVGGAGLLVCDPGIGLTVDEVHELLATIGGSAKRDELELPRAGFLGRFGVGLLSCFVVAQQIEVLTRSARTGAVARFVGSDDGGYVVTEPTAADAAVDPALWEALGDGPGSVVRLVPRPGLAGMTDAATVERLAATFGAILPVPVLVTRLDGTVADVTDPDPPWRDATASRTAQEAWCERVLGFAPLDVIPLRVPAVGLVGAAFVRPGETAPGADAGHVVHLRRMLVGDAVTGLVPDWAFFVRCVVDADELHPTASRETLVDDDALAAARDGIAEAVRAWLLRLGALDPDRLRSILHVHGRAAKALAVHDPTVLAALAPWLEVETSEGPMTLVELGRRTKTVRYAATVDRFRQLAPLARAQGLLVANAGYSYDRELLDRIGSVVPEAVAVELADVEVVSTLDDVEPGRRSLAAAFVAFAGEALEETGCAVELRAFDPEHLPALLLQEDAAARRRSLRATREVVDETWAALLGDLDDGGDDRPKLVCNDRHPLVARLVDRAGTDREVVAAAVAALYGQALLLGHHPVRPVDLAVHNRSLLALVDLATRP